jgi:hypothetical protein
LPFRRITDTSLRLGFQPYSDRTRHAQTQHLTRVFTSLSLIAEMEKGDASNGSIDIAASDASVSQTLTIDPNRGAKLVRKLDLYIAPVMTIIFLTAYIDRANLGNAASAGMTQDIGMASSQLGSKLYARNRLNRFDLY